MRSDESGRCGASLHSSPSRDSDLEGGAERSTFDSVFYCPDCGSRLRLLVEGGMVERVVRDAQPDPWSQGAADGTASVPPASADEPAESIEVTFDAAADAETPPLVRVSTLLSEPSVDSESTEGLSPTSEGDAVQVAPAHSASAEQPERAEDDVLDIDSVLESPAPPECNTAGEEPEARTLRHPSLADDDRAETAAGQVPQGEDGTDAPVVAAAPVEADATSLQPRQPAIRESSIPQEAVRRESNTSVESVQVPVEPAGAVGVSSRDKAAAQPAPVAPREAPAPEPVVRGLPSDAPMTRDAEPAPRRSSGRGYVGLGLGMAALGVAFLVYSQVRPAGSRVEGATAAAALDSIPAEPAVQAEPSPAPLPTPAEESVQAASSASEAQAAPPEASQPQPELVPSTVADTKVAQVPAQVRPPASTVRAARSAVNSETQAEDEAPVEPEVPKFDADAAAGALESAAGRASSCRQASDPSGVALVTVTFAPSGRVTTANISGPPFVGTATGSCIASTLRSAQIPPFTGSHVTVRKKVTIR